MQSKDRQNKNTPGHVGRGRAFIASESNEWIDINYFF